MPRLLHRDRAAGVDRLSPVEWAHPQAAGLLAWWGAPWGASRVLADLRGAYACASFANAAVSGLHPYVPGAAAALATTYSPAITAPIGSLIDGLPQFSCAVLGLHATTSDQLTMGRGTANARTMLQWHGTTFYVSVENGGYNQPSVALSSTGWHLVGFAFDGSLAAGSRIRFVADGAVLAHGSTTATTIAAANDWRILSASNPSTPGTQAADVWLWSRALTAGDWAALYDEALRGYPSLLRRVRGRSMAALGGTLLALSESDAFGLLDLAALAAAALGSDGASLTETAPALAASVAAQDAATLADPVTLGMATVAISTAETITAGDVAALIADLLAAEAATLAESGITGDVSRHGPTRFASASIRVGPAPGLGTAARSGPDPHQGTSTGA